jgi:hypothetical protein
MSTIQVASRGDIAQLQHIHQCMFCPPVPQDTVVSLSEYRLKPLVKKKAQATASAMIEAALGKAVLKESCGRVITIDVEPQALPKRPSVDPPIPVVLTNMGMWYDLAVRQYVRHILTPVGHNWGPWYRRARRRLSRCLSVIPGDRLTNVEYEYLVVMLDHLGANYRGQIA